MGIANRQSTLTEDSRQARGRPLCPRLPGQNNSNNNKLSPQYPLTTQEPQHPWCLQKETPLQEFQERPQQ